LERLESWTPPEGASLEEAAELRGRLEGLINRAQPLPGQSTDDAIADLREEFTLRMDDFTQDLKIDVISDAQAQQGSPDPEFEAQRQQILDRVAAWTPPEGTTPERAAELRAELEGLVIRYQPVPGQPVDQAIAELQDRFEDKVEDFNQDTDIDIIVDDLMGETGATPDPNAPDPAVTMPLPGFMPDGTPVPGSDMDPNSPSFDSVKHEAAVAQMAEAAAQAEADPNTPVDPNAETDIGAETETEAETTTETGAETTPETGAETTPETEAETTPETEAETETGTETGAETTTETGAETETETGAETETETGAETQPAEGDNGTDDGETAAGDTNTDVAADAADFEFEDMTMDSGGTAADDGNTYVNDPSSDSPEEMGVQTAPADYVDALGESAVVAAVAVDTAIPEPVAAAIAADPVAADDLGLDMPVFIDEFDTDTSVPEPEITFDEPEFEPAVADFDEPDSEPDFPSPSDDTSDDSIG